MLISTKHRPCRLLLPETDLAESENELQNVSPILRNQICGKTTTTSGFGEHLRSICSPKPEVVVFLPHIWFRRIGLTFWSSYSDSARSVSATGMQERLLPDRSGSEIQAVGSDSGSFGVQGRGRGRGDARCNGCLLKARVGARVLNTGVRELKNTARANTYHVLYSLKKDDAVFLVVLY